MANRITVAEVEELEGMTFEEIMEDNMFGTRLGVPAVCEDGCEVEIDGTCWHGHPSIAIVMGIL